MALLVWLPLIKDLHNQGTSNLTFAINGTTTGLSYSSTGGKLGGGCWQRTAADANSVASDGTLNLNGDVTMAVWAKITGGLTDSANGILSNHTHSGNNGTGMGITVKKVSDTDARISCSTGATSGGRTYQTHYGTTNILNQWHHLALTYNKTQKKLILYVDGVNEKEVANYDNPSADTKIALFTWSLVYISSSSNYKPNCYLNDVRIYDECLSPKEIKEISKGLMLHYPMNEIDGVFGGRNLALGTATPHTLTASDTSKYHYTTYSINETLPSGYYMLSGDIEITDGSFSAFTANFYKSGTSDNGTAKRVPITNNHFEVSVHKASDAQKNLIMYAGPAGSTQGNGCIFKNVKLEVGTTATPWTPAPEDFSSSFSPLYDVSGYLNNATYADASEPGWESGNSPVGDGAFTFNDSQWLVGPQAATTLPTDAITISCWAYMGTWADNNTFVSCTQGQGTMLGTYKSKVTFYVYSGEAYRKVTTSYAPTSLTSGWHHFAATCDGKEVKIYVDGKLEGTNSYGTTASPLVYNISNSLIIGAEAAGSAGSVESTRKMNGKICDVRIYATALSADDVASLYSTRYSVSNSGVFFCNNFVESDNIVAASFGSSGAAKAKAFKSTDVSSFKVANGDEINATKIVEF